MISTNNFNSNNILTSTENETASNIDRLLEKKRNPNRIGNNLLFYCCVTGSKCCNMFLSSFLLLIPTALLLATIFIYDIEYEKIIKKNFSVDVTSMVIFVSVLLLIVMFFIFFAGCTEPGILQRKYNTSIRKKFYLDNKTDYKVLNKGNLVKLSLCYTCSLIRPPRTSHCAECDNCTERFDHHCIWIGTCVGKRNYKRFILFLIVLNIVAFIHLILSLIYLVKSINLYNEIDNIIVEDCDVLAGHEKMFCLQEQKTSLSKSYVRPYIKACIGCSAATLLFNLAFVIAFVGKLLIDHLILASNNITFYENLKNKFKFVPGGNPYSRKSVYENFRFICCRSMSKTNLKCINGHRTILTNINNDTKNNSNKSTVNINQESNTNMKIYSNINSNSNPNDNNRKNIMNNNNSNSNNSRNQSIQYNDVIYNNPKNMQNNSINLYKKEVDDKIEDNNTIGGNNNALKIDVIKIGR